MLALIPVLCCTYLICTKKAPPGSLELYIPLSLMPKMPLSKEVCTSNRSSSEDSMHIRGMCPPRKKRLIIRHIEKGMAVPGDSVPLRSTPAPPTVRLVRFANGQPAGPSPCPCPGVDKPPEQPYLLYGTQKKTASYDSGGRRPTKVPPPRGGVSGGGNVNEVGSKPKGTRKNPPNGG